MSVAAVIDKAAASPCKTCFGVSLGVQLDKLKAIRSYICNERNIVLLRHFVIDRHIIFMLDSLDRDLMRHIRFLSLKRRQTDSAAAYCRLADRMYNVAAHGGRRTASL